MPPKPSQTVSSQTGPVKTALIEPFAPATPGPIARKPQQVPEPIISPADPLLSSSALPSQQTELLSESATPSPTPLAKHEPFSPTETSIAAATEAAAPRPDYSWLSEIIMRRMQELKRYPAEARLDRAEGKVVLKAVLRSDGTIEKVELFKSSGHQSLDQAAVELLQLASPFHFPRPLEKPQMTVKIPMNYRLE
jgi:protein TonB